MENKLVELYHKMTPAEQAELEAFAVFVLTRRKLRKQHLLENDIPVDELLQLVEQAGSFDWLAADAEDIYSLEDGDAVEWPETQ